jgi:hypothetical protein
MTLHQTTELARKTAIVTGIGLGIFLILFLFIQTGMFLGRIFFPPKTIPPNHAYEKLPAIPFPPNPYQGGVTYTLNTLSGDLPVFPDRINIYPITKHEPNLLNLDKAKQKATTFKFIDLAGNLLPEKRVGDVVYEWAEPTGLKRILKMDIVTFNFSISSNYLSSLLVLNAQNLSNEQNAIETAQNFLKGVNLFPTDIAIESTQNHAKEIHYQTAPQLFAITNGILTPATSLSKTQVIRVDFYQKPLTYDLDTGVPGSQKIPMTLPIFYPRPPYSTMNFWIASGQGSPEVMATNFVHQDITIPTDTVATYPIKTAKEAFEDLKNGQAYIAANEAATEDVLITNVYLGYYLGDIQQDYLMPVIVFEGNNNFFAYVSAVKEDWIQ